MAKLRQKLDQFVQELKRRKVIKLLAMYAGSAFIFLQVTDIVFPKWGLPGWVMNLVIVLLISGFVVTAVLGWIFDFTNEGFVKTEPAKEAKVEKSLPVGKRKFQLSDAIIAVLFITVLILLYPRIFRKDRFRDLRDEDGRLSVIVLPFNNITGETNYDFWQDGLQNLVISSLSNSEELSVRQYETMHDLIDRKSGMEHASIVPIAQEVAVKLDAATIIIGNLHKFKNKVRITANIMEAESGEIYRSYEVEGSSEDDMFHLADSLSFLVLNFLEIKKIKASIPIGLDEVLTNSTVAFKFYLEGLQCHGTLDYNCAIEMFQNAIKADSNFTSAMIKLAYCYGDLGNVRESSYWAHRASAGIDHLPQHMQLLLNAAIAAVDKKPYEQLRSLEKYLELFPYSPVENYVVGWIYFNVEEWESSISYFERTLEISNKIDFTSWSWTYILLGRAYHNTGRHKEEGRIFEKGKTVWPDQKAQYDFWQAVCAFSRGDSTGGAQYFEELKEVAQKEIQTDYNEHLWLAGIYKEAGLLSKAEALYREIHALHPDNPLILSNVGEFLIAYDIDIEEGLSLIESAMKEDPDNVDLQYSYGLALYKKNRLTEALEVLRKAWDLRPYYSHEHYTLMKKIEDWL